MTDYVSPRGDRDLDRWEGEGGSLGGRAPVAGTRFQRALRVARKVGVAVVGGGVLVFGVALVFLPGPAIIVIPAGLAILATEFEWPRRLTRALKRRLVRALGRLRRRRRPATRAA